MNVRHRLLTADARITWAIKWLSYIAAGCAGGTMLIAVADVISTRLFRWSIPSSVEFIEELMVLMVFLGIAYVARERGHIRVTILERYMSPGLRYAFGLFGHLVGILVIGFLSWRAFELVKYSIVTKMVKDGTIKFPLWPSELAVFVGLACLTITFILLLSRAIISEPKE
jgi:TRAP-type C4-dicarboxylate transport system permease small subunit